MRVLTWNIHLQHKCAFVLEAREDADVMCLQEVTAASMDYLARELGDEWEVLTPPQCRGAWSTEGHGVAVVLRKATFEISAPPTSAHSVRGRSATS